MGYCRPCERIQRHLRRRELGSKLDTQSSPELINLLQVCDSGLFVLGSRDCWAGCRRDAEPTGDDAWRGQGDVLAKLVQAFFPSCQASFQLTTSYSNRHLPHVIDHHRAQRPLQ